MATINFDKFEIRQEGDKIIFEDTTADQHIEFDAGTLVSDSVTSRDGLPSGHVTGEYTPPVLENGSVWERSLQAGELWSANVKTSESGYYEGYRQVVYDDTIIKMVDGATIFAFDIVTGEYTEHPNVGGKALIPTTISRGPENLYFVDGREVHAVRLGDWSATDVLWTHSMEDYVEDGTPLPYDYQSDLLYVPTTGNVINALNAADGTEVWSQNVNMGDAGGRISYVEFLEDERELWYLTDAGFLGGIDVDTQSVIAENQFTEDVYRPVLKYQNDHFFISWQQTIVCYDRNFTEMWRWDSTSYDFWEDEYGKGLLVFGGVVIAFPEYSADDVTLDAVVLSQRDGSLLDVLSFTGGGDYSWEMSYPTEYNGTIFVHSEYTEGGDNVFAYHFIDATSVSDGSRWETTEYDTPYARFQPEKQSNTVDRNTIQDGEVTRQTLKSDAGVADSVHENTLRPNERILSTLQYSIPPVDSGGTRSLTPLSDKPNDGDAYMITESPTVDGFVVIGGNSQEGAPVIQYNIVTDEWDASAWPDLGGNVSAISATANEYTSAGAALVSDQYIVVAGGGVAGSAIDKIFVLDTAADSPSWTQLSSTLPTAVRGYPSTVSYQDTMYIVGGYDGTNYVTDCTAIDPANDSITALTQYPEDGFGAGGPGVVLDGEFYTNGVPTVDGTFADNQSDGGKWYKYNIADDSWIELQFPAVMQFEGGDPTTASQFGWGALNEYNGYIVLVDGYNYFDAVDMAYYDPANDDWTAVSEPDPPPDVSFPPWRGNKRGIVHNGMLWTGGGGNEEDSILAYRLDPDPFGRE